MGKYDEEWLEREFIGYGMDRMPDPQWPGGAKACVSLVVQYYMGAVSTQMAKNKAQADSTGAQHSRW